ncbi:MAG TPA: flavodoxin domain-containing protein, partial [Caldisericia bacterium]|nr:flavodoxin domain-containing protein [Caldisericia bacterium]
EAKTYYANIILPYSDFVLKFFDKLGGLNLDIKTIAPDHGPIWRSRIPQILELYKKMAAQKFCERAIVVYDTMWHSTEMMAKAICEGLDSQGIETMLYPLESSHRTFIATELIEAGALIVGSSTLNRNMLPRVADILTYLKGLSPRNLIGASFGSYGWSGEAADQIAKMLGEMKVNLVTDPLKVKHVPKSEDLKKCYELGALLGEKLREGCKLPQQ